jgi:hypothetical protein
MKKNKKEDGATVARRIFEKSRPIAIFTEPYGDLLGIPYGLSKRYRNAYSLINLVFRLTYPYNDAELEEFLLMVIDKSFSKECDDYEKDPRSVLEKYYNASSEAEATKKLRKLGLDFVKDEGYFFTYYENDKKGNFSGYFDTEINFVPENFVPGELAKTFHKIAKRCKYGRSPIIKYHIKRN